MKKLLQVLRLPLHRLRLRVKPQLKLKLPLPLHRPQHPSQSPSSHKPPLPPTSRRIFSSLLNNIRPRSLVPPVRASLVNRDSALAVLVLAQVVST